MQGKTYKSRTEGAPQKVVSCQDARHGIRVAVTEIVHDAVEQQESTNAEPRGADDGHDPVDVCATCPAEPEQTNGDGESTHESRREASLGLNLAVLIEMRLGVLPIPNDEEREDDEDANEDAQERNALEAETETVDPGEDNRERLEPDVQQTVDQRDVQVQEEHDGLRKEQLERLDEGHLGHVAGRHVFAG